MTDFVLSETVTHGIASMSYRGTMEEGQLLLVLSVE